MSTPIAVKHRLILTKEGTASAAAIAAVKHEETKKPQQQQQQQQQQKPQQQQQQQQQHQKPQQAEASQSKEDKKKNKKEKKQEEKEKEKPQEQVVERDAPTVDSVEEARFGDLKTIQSQFRTERQWTTVGELDESKVGSKVWVRARVENVRAKGKVCFLVLRRSFSTVQAVMFAEVNDIPRDMIKYASKLPIESLVEVFASVVKPKDPTTTTQSTVELQIEKLFAINVAAPLPFQLADAARPELPEGEEKAEDSQEIRVGQVVRLDNRWIDLRIPSNQAIFRVQAAVCRFFRNFMDSRGFIEIHTPKITPGVSEGGANVFKLEYFGEPACLAQSPQLYKQMAAAGSDFSRVYEIGPVFRAENSNTHRHLCEFVGLDIEMEIMEHYREVVELLGEFFVYLFDNLNEQCAGELQAIGKQYPFEPLQYKRETLILSFKEAIALLRENGVEIGDFDDFSTPQEKLLGKLVKEKHGTDFYVIDKYPLSVRPFYTMPCPEDKNYTNSYDFFIRGEEIISGAQRIHEVPLLKKRAAECGIPESNITAYIDSFKYGCPPHGGCGIGLERVVMLFLGLNNIRKSSMFPRDPTRLKP